MGSTAECLLYQVLGEAVGLENNLEVLELASISNQATTLWGLVYSFQITMHPALSCNNVSVWTSIVVARERRLGPQRAQQEALPTGPTKGSQQRQSKRNFV